MQRREFGQTGILLSSFCFGSMRLEPGRVPQSDAIQLLEYLIGEGVTTFHSSHEYSSHAFFCEILRKVRPHRHFEHIVKIGVPHFSDTRFDAGKFRSLIDQELSALGTERLDIVQWLVRHTPNQDEPRLGILRNSESEMRECFDSLTREGKIGVVTTYPYTWTFAQEVLRMNFCRGMVTYLNLVEIESAHYLDALEAEGKGFVAIRPMAAGKLAASAEQSLEFPLLHPNVSSFILSVSSVAHAEVACRIAAGTKVDKKKFFAALK